MYDTLLRCHRLFNSWNKDLYHWQFENSISSIPNHPTSQRSTWVKLDGRYCVLFDQTPFHRTTYTHTYIHTQTFEGKMPRHCARVEVDERYKVTSGEARICPVTNNQAQVCVLRCHFSCRHQLC